MSKEDGGPAFPCGDITLPSGDFPGAAGDTIPGRIGMTLRDYFAAAAVTGLLACPHHRLFGFIYLSNRTVGRGGRDMKNERDHAEAAYEIADAMLSARKGQGV